MPFIDVGTTKRKKMTDTRALQSWERTGGICVNCNFPIDGTKDEWFVEHIRALELGGQDVLENLGPAHLACKKDKDADDHSRASKAKRAKRQALGIKQDTKPLAGRDFERAPPQRKASKPLEKQLASGRSEIARRYGL